MKTPNTDALLPCPFCGYAHIQVLGRSMAAEMCPDGTPENERMLWRVVCGNCGADHDCHDKKEWAIDAWNQRTPKPSVTSEDEIEQALFKVMTSWMNGTIDKVDSGSRTMCGYMARAILTAFHVSRKEG